ncbi:uracil-DNA glycosylase [Hoeflea sp.]|uniref:uracil-DNA glycosylase n=1 Tax=Hoeflea sp. TaxID=1940281 RepID=UPI003BB19751
MNTTTDGPVFRTTGQTAVEPDHDCALCPRLHGFIAENRRLHPEWHNGPVKTWHPPEGPESVEFLVVGLAPGLRGANRTGRPFTGDASGDLLFSVLIDKGFAAGKDLRLKRTAITNAVRCVPPANKPVGAEINTCRVFLQSSITAMPRLRAIVSLGKIAHDSTVRALEGRPAAHPFAHHQATDVGNVRLFSSYHCSRYNINTGRLTPEMFAALFDDVRTFLSG